jgi:hypothetical protein
MYRTYPHGFTVGAGDVNTGTKPDLGEIDEFRRCKHLSLGDERLPLDNLSEQGFKGGHIALVTLVLYEQGTQCRQPPLMNVSDSFVDQIEALRCEAGLLTGDVSLPQFDIAFDGTGGGEGDSAVDMGLSFVSEHTGESLACVRHKVSAHRCLCPSVRTPTQ